jgi:hypothetical protein
MVNNNLIQGVMCSNWFNPSSFRTLRLYLQEATRMPIRLLSLVFIITSSIHLWSLTVCVLKVQRSETKENNETA